MSNPHLNVGAGRVAGRRRHAHGRVHVFAQDSLAAAQAAIQMIEHDAGQVDGIPRAADGDAVAAGVDADVEGLFDAGKVAVVGAEQLECVAVVFKLQNQ